MQVPRGPDALVCPLHRKSMAKVCHTCPMWVQIATEQHPQADKQSIHEWNCALAWAPILAVKMSNHMVQLGAEMHEMRNETHTAHEHGLALGAAAVQRARDAVKDATHEAMRPILDATREMAHAVDARIAAPVPLLGSADSSAVST